MARGPTFAPADGSAPITADGQTFSIYEWRGSGPARLHVHHQDDEAWHVLEGTLEFRFAYGEQTADAGTTVFVPAGTPHTYRASDEARYLIVMPPRLHDLIAELHRIPAEERAAVYLRYASELLE